MVRAYDLCAALYAHVNRFPRAQRTLLGRLILDEALRMMAALTLANRLADKRGALEEASGHLDALRIALRLAKRLAYLPNRAYAHGKVKTAILNHSDLRSSEINVETFRNVVQLSGFVSSQAEIDTAVELTRSVAGVQSVRNDMRLR